MSDVVDLVDAGCKLPSEVLANIFHRLPLKALAACCCVCKRWNAVVKSASFLATHLANALASSTTPTSSAPKPPLMLFRLCPDSSREQYTLHRIPTTLSTDSGSSSSSSSPPLPVVGSISPPPLTAHPENRFFRVAGSCAGLVLLVDDLLHFTHNVALWNPTNRRLLRLPDPPIRRETHCPYESCFGLAYDAAASDFKVLRMVFMMQTGGRVRAELYSVKAGRWRSLMGPAPRYGLGFPRGPMAFCNGCLHYAGWSADEGGVNNVVVVFDVHRERFTRTIRFPYSITGLKSMTATVFTYHGPAAPKASASAPTIAVVHVPFRIPLRWDVWVLTEYGAGPEAWVRLARADEPAITHPFAILPPGLLLGGSPTGDVVAVELPGPRRPIIEVKLELEGLGFIYGNVDGLFRTAVPTSGVAYVETLALADVVDPERLVVYEASHPAPSQAPAPSSAGTSEELDADEMVSLLQGLLNQHGHAIARTFDFDD